MSTDKTINNRITPRQRINLLCAGCERAGLVAPFIKWGIGTNISFQRITILAPAGSARLDKSLDERLRELAPAAEYERRRDHATY